ncbi:MAG: hypothetical protein GEV06_07200 [Luteitalea sp.]|nr:hypothetical protein [Luteitalea sp.]
MLRSSTRIRPSTGLRATLRFSKGRFVSVLGILLGGMIAQPSAQGFPLFYWAEQAQLTASNGTPSDEFGRSVALDGDTLVVGAPRAQAAYILRRVGDTWTETAQLTTSDASIERFGISVAIDGDTVVVGALAEDDVAGESERGAAYVFTEAGGVWTETAKLTASNGTEDDFFGGSVAIAGNTVVVSAIGADDTKGAAYVFTEVGGVWTETATLTASNGAAYDWFGISVAIARNTIPSTVVVGAIGKAAYVFRRSWWSGTWTETAQLLPPQVSGGAFGWSVAIDGDRVVVGDPGTSNLGVGHAFVFLRYGSGWIFDYFVASDGSFDNRFGESVAVAGDRVVVGAPYADDYQGAAYVFSLTATGWTQRKLVSLGRAPGDDFGRSVAIAGNTLVAGAPNADVGGNSSQGAAYVFVRQLLLFP